MIYLLFFRDQVSLVASLGIEIAPVFIFARMFEVFTMHGDMFSLVTHISTVVRHFLLFKLELSPLLLMVILGPLFLSNFCTYIPIYQCPCSCAAI